EFSSAALATRLGFEQTIIGLDAFVIGVSLSRLSTGLANMERVPDQEYGTFSIHRLSQIDRLARLYLLLGGAVYFVVGPMLSEIPSATAVVSPLGSLIIVGACLRLWVAREQRLRAKFWTTVALLPTLPLSTLLVGGFIGFGTYWVLAVMTFL